jgi:formamidopyrimidine-DNA glycosylase
VLGEAIVAGGTSFDALYVNVNGESGYFDRSLTRTAARASRATAAAPDPPRAVHEPLSFSCPAASPPR